MSIENLQDGVGSAANNLVAANLVDKVCGVVFNAIAGNAGVFTATACTFKVPFRVGVHFDSGESVTTPPAALVGNDLWAAIENAIAVTNTATVGEGAGYNGFWLAYWQNTC